MPRAALTPTPWMRLPRSSLLLVLLAALARCVAPHESHAAAALRETAAAASPPHEPPRRSRGTVVVGTLDGVVTALDAWTGKLQWKFDSGGPMVRGGRIGGETVGAGASAGAGGGAGGGAGDASAGGRGGARAGEDRESRRHGADQGRGGDGDGDARHRQFAGGGGGDAMASTRALVVPGLDGRVYLYEKDSNGDGGGGDDDSAGHARPGTGAGSAAAASGFASPRMLNRRVKELVHAARPTMSSKGDLLVGHKDTKVFPVDPHSGQPPVAAAGEGRVPRGGASAGGAAAAQPVPADDDDVDGEGEGSDRTPASPLFVGRTEYKVRALDGHTGRTQWDVSLGEYELYQASGGAASDLDPMEVLPFFEITPGATPNDRQVLFAYEQGGRENVLWRWEVPTTALTLCGIAEDTLLFRKDLFGQPAASHSGSGAHAAGPGMDASIPRLEGGNTANVASTAKITGGSRNDAGRDSSATEVAIRSAGTVPNVDLDGVTDWVSPDADAQESVVTMSAHGADVRDMGSSSVGGLYSSRHALPAPNAGANDGVAGVESSDAAQAARDASAGTGTCVEGDACQGRTTLQRQNHHHEHKPTQLHQMHHEQDHPDPRTVTFGDIGIHGFGMDDGPTDARSEAAAFFDNVRRSRVASGMSSVVHFTQWDLTIVAISLFICVVSVAGWAYQRGKQKTPVTLIKADGEILQKRPGGIEMLRSDEDDPDEVARIRALHARAGIARGASEGAIVEPAPRPRRAATDPHGIPDDARANGVRPFSSDDLSLPSATENVHVGGSKRPTLSSRALDNLSLPGVPGLSPVFKNVSVEEAPAALTGTTATATPAASMTTGLTTTSGTGADASRVSASTSSDKPRAPETSGGSAAPAASAPNPPGLTLSVPASTPNTARRIEPSTPEALMPLGLSVASGRFQKEFKTLGILGRGGFGEVHKCKNSLDGRMYAIKQVRLSSDPRWEGRLKKVLREVKILAQLEHQNVVRYYNAWLEKDDAAFGGNGATSEAEESVTEVEGEGATSFWGSETQFGDDGDESRSRITARSMFENGEVDVDASVRADDDISTGNAPRLARLSSVSPSRHDPTPLLSPGMQSSLGFEWVQDDDTRNSGDGNGSDGDETSGAGGFNDVSELPSMSFGDLEEWRGASTLSQSASCSASNISPAAPSTERTAGADAPTASDGVAHSEVGSPKHLPSTSIKTSDSTPDTPETEKGDKLGELPARPRTQRKKSRVKPDLDLCLFIQMEYCSHLTLRERLAAKERTVVLDDVLQSLLQICEGLVYIHARDLVHRDIKPSNIFIAQRSDTGAEGKKDADAKQCEILKLGDFGLARNESGSGQGAAVVASAVEQPGSPSGSSISMSEMSMSLVLGDHTAGVGTELYASPEQSSGQSYDAKTDIFSLGMTLFELLHPPFSTAMERQVVLHNVRKGVLPEAQLLAAAGQIDDRAESCKDQRMVRLIELVKQLVAAEPKDRPSADELVEQVQAIVGKRVLSASASGDLLVRVEATRTRQIQLMGEVNEAIEKEWKRADIRMFGMSNDENGDTCVMEIQLKQPPIPSRAEAVSRRLQDAVEKLEGVISVTVEH